VSALTDLSINNSPSRFLVSTMALDGILRTSSRMIHIRLVGHHSSRNILLRVIEIAPSQIGSGLGVAQKRETGLLHVGIQRIEVDLSCQTYWSELTSEKVVV
jgi:hypothetical protein